MVTSDSSDHRCDVAMLVDEETGSHTNSGDFVLERGSMEAHVLKCLRARYRRVETVPFGPDVVETMQRLREIDPGIVFNVTEWVRGDRRLDHAITGLLEIMELRYTGTGPVGLQLARDKALSKQIVAALGVAVPRHFVVNGGGVRRHGLPFPVVVKPQYGDGSDEIGKRSVVHNEREFRARVKALRARSGEPLVCEEFVPGRDLFVALLGNTPQVLPAIELVIGRKDAAMPRIFTYRLKHDQRYRARWRAHCRRARIDPAVARTIAAASSKIFHALQLRDYARLDFRLTGENRLVFLEANPNPDLAPHTLGRNRCFVGFEYPDLIRRIVETARRRYRGGG